MSENLPDTANNGEPTWVWIVEVEHDGPQASGIGVFTDAEACLRCILRIQTTAEFSLERVPLNTELER